MREINYTYILHCAGRSLYYGWTNHLDKRIEAHNPGKGTKYTKGHRPVTLAYYEEFTVREEATGREVVVKRLSRRGKLKLID